MSDDNTELIKGVLNTISKALDKLCYKEESTSKYAQSETTITKSFDDEQRKATFVVLAPDPMDLHEDTYSAEEIAKGADDFRDSCWRPNLAHMLMMDNGVETEIIESYIAPADMNIEGVDIAKGTWLQTWKFNDDTLWQGVKDGYWTGLSIQCLANTEDLT